MRAWMVMAVLTLGAWAVVASCTQILGADRGYYVVDAGGPGGAGGGTGGSGGGTGGESGGTGGRDGGPTSSASGGTGGVDGLTSSGSGGTGGADGGTACTGDGQCAPGSPCTANNQCKSGICGTTSTGRCCTAACSNSLCAAGCDTNGACIYPVGQSCSPASCSDFANAMNSTQVDVGSCTSTGVCQISEHSCGHYKCNGTVCGTTCTMNSQCWTNICLNTGGC